MSNSLNKTEQTTVIAGLAEGNSIRSIERMTHIHRDTIMRLGVRVGEACAQILDENMRGLDCRHVEVDEIWGFVGKKKKNVTPVDSPDLGDVWTFIAVDAETKIVPCYRVGKRDSLNAHAFLYDLSLRLKNRIQLSADAMESYVGAVQQAFGTDGVDFGQIVKTYSPTEASKAASSRYSPGEVVEVKKAVVYGKPVMDDICTSYVERQNLTLRMHCRRLTRLTNAFSKKLDNFKAAIGLHFAYYNFVLKHGTLGVTPAMAAGVAKDFWTVADLVECAS
jgi:IS1 family transposase